MTNRFKESLLDKNTFSVTWELVPGRGAREPQQEAAIQAAEEAAKEGKIHALTITDNPGGNPAILADYLSLEVFKKGIEPLVHFTCKDKNRNQMESQLYALERANVRNLLVMTGDYPVSGFKGQSKPVFDLDSVQALQLVEHMNKGLEYQGPRGTNRLEPSNFFAGAAVSPFKITEAEVMVQYYKLKKKLEAGAKYIVTQVGYDARKYHELLLMMEMLGSNAPVIGNIYILPFGAARIMNNNRVPGCVVTDKLLEEIDEERNSFDKGLEARLIRAAKMYAWMKGIGLAGVHLGGHNIKYEQVEFVIEKGEELSKNWEALIEEFDFPQGNGFYVFEKDEKTGLNLKQEVSRKDLPLDDNVPFVYKLSRFVHNLIFEPNKNLFGPMQKVSAKVEGSRMEKPYHWFEHMNKVLLYDCKDCGDCALMDIGYVCPISQCPKNQRNGACEGGYDGWCEVYPEKRKCIWVKAYSRLKKYGDEEMLNSYTVKPNDWGLNQTSSWINFYLGKDHSAERLGIKNPKENN